VSKYEKNMISNRFVGLNRNENIHEIKTNGTIFFTRLVFAGKRAKAYQIEMKGTQVSRFILIFPVRAFILNESTSKEYMENDGNSNHKKYVKLYTLYTVLVFDGARAQKGFFSTTIFWNRNPSLMKRIAFLAHYLLRAAA
jgi:hypothetical protein